jgi:hypothetical protein
MEITDKEDSRSISPTQEGDASASITPSLVIKAHEAVYLPKELPPVVLRSKHGPGQGPFLEEFQARVVDSKLDPPLGGFHKLPIRSQLRSVKGVGRHAKKHGRVSEDAPSAPNVKAVMLSR